MFLSVTKVRLYLFGIVKNAHIHLQWNATNNSNEQQKLDHTKSNMTEENAVDDEQTVRSDVVAVSAVDHAPRQRNVIGWNKFASWIFSNMKINWNKSVLFQLISVLFHT